MILAILESYLEPFLAAEDSVPHVIAGPGSTLLRMLLPFHVEVQGDLGVDTNAEVAVHDALLIHQIPAMNTAIYNSIISSCDSPSDRL